MGKWLGFTITEFSVGLGPKIFGIKGKETEFTLRALPIGGSCRFFGEDGKDEDDRDKKHPEAFEEGDPEEKPEEKPKEPDPRLFSSKPAWKRFLVVAAGPVVNILTCTVLCFVMLLSTGEVIESSTNELMVVDEVTENGPAAKAGMQPGDVIVSMDGKLLTNADDLDAALKDANMNGMTMDVLRGAEVETTETKDGRLTTTIVSANGGTLETLEFGSLLDQETGNKRIKIKFLHPPVTEVTEQYGVGKAALKAFPKTWEMGKLVYESLGMLIRGEARCSDMSGIVGTVDAVSGVMTEQTTASDRGFTFLWFMALIAVNLGIVNLLPLPALDGGRILFVFIRAVFRGKISDTAESYVHAAGMVLLMALMVFLVFNDTLRLFGK
jgi:regulator of sigma E protease